MWVDFSQGPRVRNVPSLKEPCARFRGRKEIIGLYYNLKNHKRGAKEMAWQLRALAAIPEDPVQFPVHRQLKF